MAAARPPVVFVHGLYHAAWCWEENWMTWLAAQGYCCYAVSLRGQGGSSLPSTPPKLDWRGAAVTPTASMQEHVGDLGEFLASLPVPAVLVGHSLGGCIAQAYLSACLGCQQQAEGEHAGAHSSGRGSSSNGGMAHENGSCSSSSNGEVAASSQGKLPVLAGMVLVAAPCVGTLGLIREFIADVGVGVFARLVWVLVSGGALRSPGSMRTCWFSGHLEDAALQRYFERASSSSKMMPMSPEALMGWQEPPPDTGSLPPVLAIAGGQDVSVRPFQVKAAVEFWGAHYEELEDVAHDVMLDTHWERGAETLHRWLAASFPLARVGDSQAGGASVSADANAPASEQLVV